MGARARLLSCWLRLHLLLLLLAQISLRTR